jgi:N-acetylmuramic acid 6-phosphate (MurNAc-6-P) etherase
VLALKFKPVMTLDSTFADWCVHRLASMIGPRKTQATAATVSIQGSPAITTTQTQAQITPNVLATQEMVKSFKLMAEMVMKMSDKNVKIAEQAVERALKKEAREFTQYMEAALMGWAGVTAKQSIPMLWIKFLTSKRMDNYRLNLHRRMKELAKKKEMEFEHNC